MIVNGIRVSKKLTALVFAWGMVFFSLWFKQYYDISQEEMEWAWTFAGASTVAYLLGQSYIDGQKEKGKT